MTSLTLLNPSNIYCPTPYQYSFEKDRSRRLNERELFNIHTLNQRDFYIINLSYIDKQKIERRTMMMIFSISQQIMIGIVAKVNAPRLSLTCKIVLNAHNNQRNPEYAEVVKSVTNLPSLEETLDHLPESERTIEKLLRALKKANWKDPVFKLKDYPLYALKALREGGMTPHQFGTIQLHWTAHQKNRKVEILPLFSKSKENSLALLQILPQVLTPQIGKVSFLSQTKMREFFQGARKLPLSERQFFVVADDPDSKLSGGKETFSQSINFKINIFCRFIFNGQKMRMIPSVGLMQNYLNLAFENPVRINISLGMSPVEDFFNHSARVMGVPFPGVFLETIIHGLPGEFEDFTFHDLYHAISMSILPIEERKVMLKIAYFTVDFIRKMNEQCISLKERSEWNRELPEFRVLVQKIVDFDYYFFNKKKYKKMDHDGDMMFWERIRYFIKVLNGDEDCSLEDYSSIQDTFIKQLMQYIVTHFPAVVKVEKLNEIIETLNIEYRNKQYKSDRERQILLGKLNIFECLLDACSEEAVDFLANDEIIGC